MQVIKKLIPFLIAILLFVCCTKEGDTIYKPNPDEEQPSTAPLVTVIYGPNSLGACSSDDDKTDGQPQTWVINSA